jgi:hypothetical protein
MRQKIGAREGPETVVGMLLVSSVVGWIRWRDDQAEPLSSMLKPCRRRSAPQACAQCCVNIGVVALEYADLKFVGSGSWVAGVDVGASDEMITHAGKEERPWDGAADAARLVFDCELEEVLYGDAGGIGVVEFSNFHVAISSHRQWLRLD